MSVKREVRWREEGREGSSTKGGRRGKGTTEEELQERGEKGNRLRGLSVVGRRTLQIPVNRIQLRCYREYRWRLFPSVHPIHNARPYGVDSRARTKGRGEPCLCTALRTNDQTVWLFQDVSVHGSWNSIFADVIKRFPHSLSRSALERSSRMKLLIFYWKNIMATTK